MPHPRPIARLRLIRLEVRPLQDASMAVAAVPDAGNWVHPDDALTGGDLDGRIGGGSLHAKGLAMNRILLALALSSAAPAWAADAPALYQKHCAACHGPGGRGDTATPPIAGMAAAKVEKAVNSHKPPMEKTGMTADEVAALSRWVAGQKK